LVVYCLHDLSVVHFSLQPLQTALRFRGYLRLGSDRTQVRI
jgi:hypothetical protein